MKKAALKPKTLIPAKATARSQALVARRSLTVDGKRYPRGSALPSHRISAKALQAMLDSRAAVWEPVHHGRAYPQPIDLPKADKPKPQPAVQIVEDRDPVTSWVLTYEAMTRVCDGDAATARDLLYGVPEARALFLQATKELCHRLAKRWGTWSVSPDTAWREYYAQRKKAA